MIKARRLRYGITMMFFLWNTLLFSQDIHFSQYFNSPATLSPALAGFSDANMRLFLNHKSQWRSVTVPFTTFAAAIDGKLFQRQYKGDIIGFGLSAYSDKAGDSHFGTNEISLALNYIKALDQNGQNILSFGIQGAWAQRSLDYEALYFDSQYNGSNFDPNLPIGENFSVTQYSYSDLSAGVNFYSNISYDFVMNTGLSVWHINRPGQSLLHDDNVRLNVKYMAYFEGQWGFSMHYALLPATYFSRQGPYTEWVTGARIKYIADGHRALYKAFSAGLFYRNSDALILYSGFDYKQMTIGLSYDVNISTLVPASRYMGGFEVSFTWNYFHHPKPKGKDLPCPIF